MGRPLVRAFIRLAVDDTSSLAPQMEAQATKASVAAGRSGSRGFVRAFAGGVRSGLRSALDADREASEEGAQAGRKWTSAFRRTAKGESGGAGGGGLFAGLLGGAALKGGLLAGGAAAGAGLFFAIKTGIQQAAANEQAIIGFDTLLPGGAAVADRFFGDLKKFAATTPFELPGLVDAARGLLGVGVASKAVLPTLTSLGNASAALGLDQERFGRVLLAVNQIIGKGKASGEELAQITEAGIPVWTLLAKATGKPIPELQKLASEGKLLAKDTLPTLFAQMNKDYGGAMTKQSQTLNGVWSTVKDTFKNSLAEALLPLIPVLTVALPRGAELFAAAVTGISGVLQGLAGPAKAIGGVLAGIFSGLGSSGAGSSLASLFGPLKAFATTVAPPLVAAGQQIRQILGKAFTEIGTIISTQLVPAFAAFLPAVAPIARFLLSVFGSAVVGALKGVVNVVKGVLTVLAGIFNVIAGVLTGDWSRLWQGIKQIVGGALRAVLGIVQVVLNVGILKLFRLGFALIKGVVVGGWAVIRGIFTGGGSAISSLVGRALLAVGRFFLTGMASAGRAVASGFSRLVSAAGSGVSSLIRTVAGIPGRILSGLGNLGSILFNAGASVIRGLISGVESQLGRLRDIAASAASTIRNLFPFSPAKEGPLRKYPMEKAGRNIIEGLTDGMTAGRPGLAATSAAVAGDVTGGPFTPFAVTAGPSLAATAEDIGAAVYAAFARAGLTITLDGQTMGRLVDQRLDATARQATARRGAI